MTDELEPTTHDDSEVENGEDQGDDSPDFPAEAQQEIPLVTIIDTVADRADPLIEIIKNWAEQSLKTRQSERKYQMRMTVIAVGLVAFIVVTASVLTYLNRMSGSTLSFLLGLVVGYVLTFVRDAINPEQEAG